MRPSYPYHPYTYTHTHMRTHSNTHIRTQSHTHIRTHSHTQPTHKHTVTHNQHTQPTHSQHTTHQHTPLPSLNHSQHSLAPLVRVVVRVVAPLQDGSSVWIQGEERTTWTTTHGQHHGWTPASPRQRRPLRRCQHSRLRLPPLTTQVSGSSRHARLPRLPTHLPRLHPLQHPLRPPQLRQRVEKLLFRTDGSSGLPPTGECTMSTTSIAKHRGSVPQRPQLPLPLLPQQQEEEETLWGTRGRIRIQREGRICQKGGRSG